jgi:DNA (cytosine-5)-methyltransferase 1/tRNA (cytosine38-C5)-methyltransferase
MIPMRSPLRVLELFCGIGGCAAAVGQRAHVVAAVDIDRTALDIYARNFPHETVARTIESIPCADYRAWEADLWWLSPPCQPYTRRGQQRDLADPRAAGLLAVIDRIPQLLPSCIALENVPPFQASQAYRHLRETLHQCHYQVHDVLLCPTELGIPNRRHRFYLVASRCALRPVATPCRPAVPLADFLDERPDPALELSAAIAQRYASAIDLVDAGDLHACSSCFTSAYGRSHIRSGSYLLTPTGLRRFSPREILRLLGFPDSFHLPDNLPMRQAWRHVGNSLSVVAVRHVLSVIPALAGA